MIPITEGLQVGHFVASPKFDVQSRETRLGRIDAYVVPVGGELLLDSNEINKIFKLR
jgi:hypothetical protein